MNKKKIELQVLNISNSQAQAGAYALVLGVKLMRILIYKVDNGVFYSYLYMKAEETILRIDARTSDAVALALRMNAPIFVY